MSNSQWESIRKTLGSVEEYGRLKREEGADITPVISKAERAISEALNELTALTGDAGMRLREPDGLEEILALRPNGPRRLWDKLPAEAYADKLEGALLGRMAGCTLGAAVELWPIEEIERWAAYCGDAFPPLDYWSRSKDPSRLHYGISPNSAFTKEGMDGVPADDDVVYTVLGLLIAEEHGLEFSTADAARSWLDHLPIACTAEEVALNNLKAGIDPLAAAERNNPFVQWIGAYIRSDPWAYMAPGWPEKAARMAYRDAYLSHRRNGIYGEMFFSAVQSAAFYAKNAREALGIGLTEIPKDCELARDIAWALEISPEIKDYRQARSVVDERFPDMSPVHTRNNACLTVFGLALGGGDVAKTISLTVAMGLDNDCNAATAGSIAGALAGRGSLGDNWTRPFNGKIVTYLKGNPVFSISDVLARFAVLAALAHESGK